MDVIGILVASFVAFMIGGVWYGPLFLKTWKAENGFDDNYLKDRNMPMIFGASFVLFIVMAGLLARFITTATDLQTALVTSATMGVFALTAYGVTYLFEKRSLKIWMINAGYMFLNFIVMGLILHFI